MSRGITQSPIRYWRTMPRRGRAGALLLTACLLALTILTWATKSRVAYAQSGDGQSPDYSQVTNFTNGNQHLLRADDLSLTFSGPDPARPFERQFLLSVGTNHDAANAYRSNGNVTYDAGIVPGGKGPCPGPGPCPARPAGAGGDTPLTYGRFFRTGQDAAVKFDTQWSSDTGPLSYKVVTLMGKSLEIKAPLPFNTASYLYAAEQDCPFNLDSTVVVKTAVADFNGDGYDDLLIAYSDYLSGAANNARVRIATAVNLDDPSQGFNIGPEQALGFGEAIRAVAAGDFNSDGQPDFATLRVEGNNSLILSSFTVDPATLAVAWSGQQVMVDTLKDTIYRPMELRAVTMTNSPLNQHKQLVVAYTTGTNQQYVLTLYDFPQNSFAFNGVSTVGTALYATEMKMKAGRLSWASPNDQIVIMLTTANTSNPSNSLSQIKVFSLSATNQLSTTPGLSFDVRTQLNKGDGKYVALDFAIGNFDNWNAPTDQVPAVRNPNLKIAIATAQLVNGSYSLIPVSPLYPTGRPLYYPDGNIYYLNLGTGDQFALENTIPYGSAFMAAVNYETANTCATYPNSGQPFYYVECNYDNWHWRRETAQGPRYLGFYGLSLDALDLQGRSLRLGSGYKVSVDRTAPTAVLAVPPMHADYITPTGSTTPTVLNLSVAPDGFHSEYEVEVDNDTSTVSTQKTSSTLGFEESVGGSLQLGKTKDGELESGVKISDTATATQDTEKSAETKHGSFTASGFSISQETGLSDVVWFKDSTFYLYVYEVAGQKVCPADKPNCQESEKQPLRVIFSAPKETSVQRLAADTLEWYQPPWEPENLLSYPASLSQLKLYLPNMGLLTKDNSVYGTDDAGTTFKTTWSNGVTTGQSIAQKETLGWKNDFSFEGKKSFEAFGYGGSAELDVDFSASGSKVTENLQETETKTTSSQGISVSKTATFADPFSYKYFFSPFIFGQTAPDGYTGATTSDANLTTFGALRSAFTADPLSSGAGGWWKQAYTQFPDVAVNHPNRWAFISSPKDNTGNLSANCISINTQTKSCVKPTEREPENPWLDPFHDMRGFFITNANTPGQGGQLQLAKAGDQLSLQTRVYNYSLKPMPAGSKVKVAFYGMEWDTSVNKPVESTAGSSFRIGDVVTLDPIPAFSNVTGAPLNWVLAGTTFDTTNYADKDIAFWVVVWMEDGNGNLLQEPSGKGLNSRPEADPYVKYFPFTDEQEPLVDNPTKTDDSDPAKVSFSNNIGFYRWPLHINPRETLASAAKGSAQIEVESVATEAAAIKQGKPANIRVALRNGSAAATSLTVYFFDGDPAQGGKLFDAEHVAYIRPDAKHDVSVIYRLKQCGLHRIFIRVTSGGDVIAKGNASQTLQVECPTPICTAKACMKSAQYYARNVGRLPQGTVTVFGRGLQSQASTQQTALMNSVLQGGTGGLAQLNQQFVTTQLNLLGQGVLNQGALGSNLLCYGINFQPAQLSTGVSLDPSLTLGQLFDQARRAGSAGNAIDARMIATVLHLLNGDDPSGRCQTDR